MRIRKNKKLSEMGYEGLHAPYHCQLNQSPWDAVSFSQQTSPSSSNFLQSNDNSDGNWHSVVCASPRLEKSEGGNEMTGGTNKQKERGESERETGKEGKFRWEKSEKECVRCQKIEGCCCLNLGICSAKKHQKPVRRNFLATKRLAREPNRLQSTTNGFYYYSGFGSCWAKNRQD